MRARCLAIAVGIALFVACGGSPLAPTNEIEVSGAVIWTDPEHGQFVPAATESTWWLATVTPTTKFFGDIRSAAELFSAFQTGSRIQMTVIGSPTGVGASGNQDLLASRVTSARSAARLEFNGWGGSFTYPVPIYDSRLTAVVSYHDILVVRPWTVFDPTGDITTYEGFLAAASTGEIVTSTSATGDSWYTGFYTYHARSLKVIRTSKKSSATSGAADARGWAIYLRPPFNERLARASTLRLLIASEYR